MEKLDEVESEEMSQEDR